MAKFYMSHYSKQEEQWNVISHLVGFILSIPATVLLVYRAVTLGDIWHVVSFSIFGISMIILYAASTTYHSAKKPKRRQRLRIFDHAAIYILIAGTYTPFALVSLQGKIGWIVFGVAWFLAASGIILKLFFTGRFKLLSTLTYIGMGWIVIFVIQRLIENLSIEGAFWSLGGGIVYSIGAIFYSIKKIPFNHAIFHGFVLAGTSCHFVAIYGYLI